MYDTKDPFDNVETDPDKDYWEVAEKPIDSLIEIKEEKVDTESLDMDMDISNENTVSSDNDESEPIIIKSSHNPSIKKVIPLVIPGPAGKDLPKQKPEKLQETKKDTEKTGKSNIQN